MIEENLEIILITYNREKYLKNTLDYFLNSPFKDCKFTVLNNNSTDNTEDICKEYQKKFTNFHFITHNKNIGGNPNILRAYEIATLPYLWLIADNDEYDFSECDDVIDAINSNKYDVILTFSEFYEFKNGKSLIENMKEKNNSKNYQEIYAQDLLELEEKGGFFSTFTFLPALILKTNNITEEIILKGYNNTQNLFPHLPNTIKIIVENQLIFKSKNNLVIFKPNPEEATYFTTSDLIIGYLNSSMIIKNHELKNKYLNTILSYSLIKNIIHTALIIKINKEKKFKELNISILNAKGLRKGLKYILISFVIRLLPIKVCKILLNIGKNNFSN